MNELMLEVAQEADGGFTAEAIGEAIFTQADTWKELKANVREAVQPFHFDSAPPRTVRLRIFRKSGFLYASSSPDAIMLGPNG